MVYISFMGGKPLINGSLKFVQFKTQFFWFKINILARYRQHCGKEIKSKHRKMMVFISSMGYHANKKFEEIVRPESESDGVKKWSNSTQKKNSKI